MPQSREHGFISYLVKDVWLSRSWIPDLTKNSRRGQNYVLSAIGAGLSDLKQWIGSLSEASGLLLVARLDENGKYSYNTDKKEVSSGYKNQSSSEEIIARLVMKGLKDGW